MRVGGRNGKSAFAACAGLATLGACSVAAAGDVRFFDTRTLPAAGLQLRVLSNSSEVPQPPPHAYVYRLQAGGKESTVEMFDPRELWIAGQHEGRWRDSGGNTLTLATIRAEFPTFERKHVTREAYDEAVAPRRPDAWSTARLTQWLRDFTGEDDVNAEALDTHTARYDALVHFELPGSDPPAEAYAFRLNPGAIGQREAPPDWFAAVFTFGPGTDVARAGRTIRTRFLQYITAARSEARPNATPSRVFQATPVADDGGSEAMQASRRQVAASIANLKDWWFTETENYILLSNMRPNMRGAVRELQTNVETLRIAFARLVPARAAIDTVSVIRIPATAEDYERYVGEALSWSMGIWQPNRKELVIRSLEGASSRDARASLLSTTYHEAFHQYVFYALAQIETSAWFNEGHASLFESVDIGRRRLSFAEDRAKVQFLTREETVHDWNIQRLLRLSYADFYAATDAERSGNYALAWALVYYLRRGIVDDRRSPFAGILDDYLERLWRTRSADVATEGAFADVDAEALQRDLRAFWNSSSRRRTAARHRVIDL